MLTALTNCFVNAVTRVCDMHQVQTSRVSGNCTAEQLTPKKQSISEVTLADVAAANSQ